MIRLNMLPASGPSQQTRRLRQHLAVLACALLLSGGATGAYVWHLQSQVDVLAQSVAELQAESATLKKQIAEVDKAKKLRAALEKKLAVLATLDANRQGPVRLLEGLARALPRGTWITGLSLGGGTINLEGKGLTEAHVARLLQSLEASEAYQGVELTIIEQAKVDGTSVQSFKITARPQPVAPGGPR